MLRWVKGDMFRLPMDIRVNAVNCVGVMGSGIARTFRQRYPGMFRNYQQACEQGEVQPGRLHIWNGSEPESECVINFPTKSDWRDVSQYDYIERGLTTLRTYLECLIPLRIAVPALGCGHGGLEWSRVSAMITARLEDLNHQVFMFAPIGALHDDGQ